MFNLSFKRIVKNKIVDCFLLHQEGKIKNEEIKRGNAKDTNTRVNYNLCTLNSHHTTHLQYSVIGKKCTWPAYVLTS